VSAAVSGTRRPARGPRAEPRAGAVVEPPVELGPQGPDPGAVLGLVVL